MAHNGAYFENHIGFSPATVEGLENLVIALGSVRTGLYTDIHKATGRELENVSADPVLGITNMARAIVAYDDMSSTVNYLRGVRADTALKPEETSLAIKHLDEIIGWEKHFRDLKQWPVLSDMEEALGKQAPLMKALTAKRDELVQSLPRMQREEYLKKRAAEGGMGGVGS